jgi:class 3 adenylate cyclase
MVCPKCGFDNPQSLAFCGRCGSPTTLTSPLRSAAPRASHPSRAERRQLTVMFCDLVGSTALSGRLDPEELNDLTHEYQSICAEIVERHAGRIASFLGDGLLVYFGYPFSHEDDAQRAVRAGLEIAAALGSARERSGKPLQVRVAVHTGLVVVGQLGGETNPDPMAISGETPNIAARLQSVGEPGQVVVSAATYRLIQGFFVCRSLGTPALKGVAAPAEAFEVLEETGERWWQAEIYRLNGEMLLRRSVNGLEDEQAEEYFRRALQTAREQCAQSFELRAMMSLSRLPQKRGKRTQARQMLTEVYNRFTEGFDTADLREARALLEQT